MCRTRPKSGLMNTEEGWSFENSTRQENLFEMINESQTQTLSALAAQHSTADSFAHAIQSIVGRKNAGEALTGREHEIYRAYWDSEYTYSNVGGFWEKRGGIG